MNRLKEKYIKEVVAKMMKKFNYKNIHQVPKVEKVTVNMGVGEAIAAPKTLDSAIDDLARITGQKPLIRRAKKSIAAFKLRQNAPIGCKVTLRGEKMYDFLDKLFNIVIPRIRDFRGLSSSSFDGRGNYSLGIKEQIVFPEIDYDKIDQIRGLDICITTNSKNDEEAKSLLKFLGMPIKD
jgi:large subunit ribosomal protein L5